MNRVEAGRLGWDKIKERTLAIRSQNSKAIRDLYKEQPKKCLRCTDEIPFEKRRNRFCTHSCAAAWTNRKREVKVRACEVCGQLLKRAASKFCSNACQAVMRWKVCKAEILSSKRIVSGNPQIARRYLMETNGRRCVKCKITEWQGQPTPLVLDHIDGNSDNWALINLRLLCPNCDAQTPTYKAKNRGNGRFSRRERYRLGQSY